MTVSESLESIAGLLRALPVDALGSLDDRELVRIAELEGVIGRLHGSLAVSIAGEIVARSGPELRSEGLAARHGHSKPAHLVQRLSRVSNREATDRIRLSAAVRGEMELSGWERPAWFPALAERMRAGAVDPDAAGSIVRCLEAVRRVAIDDEWAVAERALAGFASAESADDVAILARAIRDRLDPDGVRPREEESQVRRGIRLGRERNGITPISGGLDPEIAALVKGAFAEANSPSATPRFLARESGNESADAASAGGDISPNDTRTRDQRQHDVFAGIFTAGLRNSGTADGQLRSTVDISVTIAQADLAQGRGPGFLAGIAEPVSTATVERLLCDATYRRAVLGSNGEPLALGKTQYRFSAAQRRAIILRDGDRCAMCDTPASWGDFHHVIPFNADGGRGRTDLANGVNLCRRHHRLFHDSEWKVRIRDGLPEVLPPPDVDWTARWRPVGDSRFRRILSSTG